MAVNVKMGVDLSAFTSGIREGQGILKGLNAEMKAAQAEFKATGNAEQLLQNKTKTLNSQLQIQKGIADQAGQALQAMTDAGINPADAAYQKMYATMMNAQAGMNSAQAELNALGESANTAADGADHLSDSVNSINKKISLDQVISGIDKITSGLERAAKKAADLGKELWDQIMDSARRADDTATMAEMYGIDLDTFMRMQKLVAGGMDTSVEAMLGAQDKLKKGIGKDNKEIIGYMEELGLVVKKQVDTGFGMTEQTEWITKNPKEMFWRAGKAIMAMGDAFDKEAAASALFGKSWKELVPLFNTFSSMEEYNNALAEQTVNTEETIRDLAALNDAVSGLESSWTTLKDEVLGSLAPALTKGAEAISGLLDNLTEYLKTEQGQQMLDNLGKAVEGLFKDISEIDPQEVVKGFSDVFTGIVSGVQWLAENSGTVVGALEAIVVGWGALELTGGALKIYELVQGITGLAGGGAEAAGSAAGSAWGGAFASAVMAAAPWLIGLYTLLNPSATDGGGVVENGQVTQASIDLWNNEPKQWEERQLAVGNRYGALSELMGNQDALNIMLNASLTDEEVFRQLEEKLGIKPLDIPYEMHPAGDTAEEISEQVGTVVLNAALNISAITAGGQMGKTITGMPSGGGGGGPVMYIKEHANGLPYVPYDGLRYLHQGEVVLPAREVASRNFSSNLYVESMYMNNGQDADGLAAAIAAAQRRTMAGYGS